MEQPDEKILAAIGFVADLSMRAGALDEILPRILERLALSVDASRAYVFENRTDPAGELLMNEIAEWCAPGVAPTIDSPANRMLPYLPDHAHYVKALSAGEPMVIHLSSAEGADLQDLEDEGILSCAFVPVFLGDEWWGYLGFDDCVSDRDWSVAEVRVLEAAAGIVGATIDRRSTRAVAEPTAPSFRSLVERIAAVTYIDVVDDPDVYPYPTLYMSPQIESITGYPADAFVRDPGFWDQVIHPDDLVRIAEMDMDPSARERFEADYRMIARGGNVVWVHDEAEMVSSTPDHREIWHGVLYDITALKEDAEREKVAAEKLRALDAMKDTFIDAVSHELRTPVAAILGLSSTLERNDPQLSEEEKQEFVGRITRNAVKLGKLIEDLLDLNRMNYGVLAIDVRPLRVDEIAREVLEVADLPATHEIAFLSEPATALVDRTKVGTIVENLLRNATRHTAPGTPVTLSVHPSSGGALIKVDDAGPGVDPELRESIFEPFQQAGKPVQGVGIGLSLVARFAQMHGGRAWVEESPGGGASFCLFLPGEPAHEPA
jgi:PAS domain S-box-containing protein